MLVWLVSQFCVFPLSSVDSSTKSMTSCHSNRCRHPRTATHHDN